MIKKKRTINLKFVVCVNDEGCKDLHLWKVYPVIPDDTLVGTGRIRIIDETRKDQFYSENHFQSVELPSVATASIEEEWEMPTAYNSDVLTAEELKQAMEALPVILKNQLGDSFIVTANYMYGCEIHPQLKSVTMEVVTRWLGEFVGDSLRQRIVIPCESDFLISVPENRLDILFCHENDIHMGGNDQQLIEVILASEPFSRFLHPKKI